jgi:F0F1-type ATP synthase assembly protein I
LFGFGQKVRLRKISQAGSFRPGMAETPHKPTRDSKPTGEVSPWALAGLGMQFGVAIIVFVYAGNWLDRRLDTAPLFLLSGVLVGGGGVFYASYRRLMATSERTSSTQDADHDSPPSA